MTPRLLVLAGSLLLVACTGSPTLPTGRFVEERRYGYVDEGCNPVDEFACGQEILLRPDGTIQINMTDILTGGTYRIERQLVQVDVEWGDDGHHYTFALSADGATLTDIQHGTVWHRRMLRD